MVSFVIVLSSSHKRLASLDIIIFLLSRLAEPCAQQKPEYCTLKYVTWGQYTRWKIGIILPYLLGLTGKDEGLAGIGAKRSLPARATWMGMLKYWSMEPSLWSGCSPGNEAHAFNPQIFLGDGDAHFSFCFPHHSEINQSNQRLHVIFFSSCFPHVLRLHATHWVRLRNYSHDPGLF